ncbi:MAG: tetratricopeptide repeat protein [Peptococcales bacterium]
MPLKSKDLYQEWLEAVNNHDFTKAEDLYLKLIEIDPTMAEVNFPMGIWYKENGLWDKAKAAFLRALATDPHIDSETYYYLGNVTRESKEYEEAISYFQKALDANPQFFEAQYNLGKVYALQGRSEDALEAFLKALELNPQDLDTYVNIGVELSNQGQREKALEMYQKALELDPYSYLVYSNIGVEYTLMGEYDKAINFHKKALELNAFYGDGWYNLACTYARMQDLDNSLKNLERAIRLDDENIAYAKNDPELASVRDTREFKKLVKQWKREKVE